jgi:hypothetical protein
MSYIFEYFIVACPVEHIDIMCNAASHFDDGGKWDNATYQLSDWRTANSGAYVMHHYPAGDNMQAVVSAWVDSNVPSSSAVFDALRIQRGPNDPLTDEEIQTLRTNCLVGVQVDEATWFSDNGLTEDLKPIPWQ